MQNQKGSIYRKLVMSYVLFALLVVFIFGLSLFMVFMTVTRGKAMGLASPYAITDAHGCQQSMQGIINMGGWIEELDDTLSVTNILGEKKTQQQKYTPKELFRFLSGNDIFETEYIGFLNERTDQEGYYLVMFGRGDMRLTSTVLYGPDNSDPRWNKLFLLVFFGLFTGLCVLLGYYLSRRIKRPLSILMEAMERVQRGEENVVLNFQAEAEFAGIRDAFNIMSSSLEQAKREKQEAERKRDRLLLELSHDIRTPIATINSYAFALEQDLVDSKEQKRYYEVIRQKAQRVNQLAEDMFTMLKMQSSEYMLSCTKGDLCEFLRRECAEYYEEALEKGMEFIIKIPEEPVLVEADFILLKRVTGNLFSNAIKYNQKGFALQVSLLLPDAKPFQTGVIEIADDGEEIAEELREHIFDDFIRGDRARKSDGGTGLGLSIAKAIVEKHGGELSYCYQDGWNQFRVELRCSR